MPLVNNLVPSRFLTITAHLVIVITIFWSRVRELGWGQYKTVLSQIAVRCRVKRCFPQFVLQPGMFCLTLVCLESKWCKEGVRGRVCM